MNMVFSSTSWQNREFLGNLMIQRESCPKYEKRDNLCESYFDCHGQYKPIEDLRLRSSLGNWPTALVCAQLRQ
jgi:hypothetical protein